MKQIRIEIILRVFVLGMLWGAALAVLEALLFQRWYHVELKPAASNAELVINYALYAGLVASIFLVISFIFRAIRPRSASPGPVIREEVVFDRELSLKVTDALFAAFIPIIAANYLWTSGISPLLPHRVGLVILAVSSLVCGFILAWIVYRFLERLRSALRSALLLWVAAGLLWTPLFGRYNGVFSKPGGKAQAGSHPNVVLIVTDTERRDFLDCYGASWHASPATDRVAEDGALFLNHVVQSTWTLPSTASLLTGQFPSSHGAVKEGLPVSGKSPMLPEALRKAGYRTGAFTENFHILPRNGFGRGVDEFWAIWLPWVFDRTVLYRFVGLLGLPVISLTEKDAYPKFLTSPEQVNWDARTTTDRVLDWLNSLDDEPFFAYVHYMGPHGPYGPREFLLDVDPPPVPVADHPKKKGGGLPLGEPGEPVSADELKTIRTLYAADILYVENQITRILDWLERANKAAETIVVLTSDHGEEFYEHRAWNHGGSAFDEVLRVPLVIRAPGLVKPGLRIEASTRHVDVMPTVLDIAGIGIPDGVQGRSLRVLLEGGSMKEVPAYTEVYPIRPAGCSIFSLVDFPYKFINVNLGGKTATMLFDMSTDPAERNNIASSLPGISDKLQEEMDTWDEISHLYTPDSEAVPIDPATLKKLKSLGYVN